MTNKLSDLGDSIFVDGEDGERKTTGAADGTAKAGWLVGFTATSSAIRGVNATGDLDEFTGILAPRYDIDLDSAITAAKIVEVVYPKAGHRYRVAVYLAAAAYVGEPMILNTGHAGMLQVGGNLEAEHVARLSKDAANGDNFAEVVWGV